MNTYCIFFFYFCFSRETVYFYKRILVHLKTTFAASRGTNVISVNINFALVSSGWGRMCTCRSLDGDNTPRWGGTIKETRDVKATTITWAILFGCSKNEDPRRDGVVWDAVQSIVNGGNFSISRCSYFAELCYTYTVEGWRNKLWYILRYINIMMYSRPVCCDSRRKKDISRNLFSNFIFPVSIIVDFFFSSSGTPVR